MNRDAEIFLCFVVCVVFSVDDGYLISFYEGLSNKSKLSEKLTLNNQKFSLFRWRPFWRGPDL